MKQPIISVSGLRGVVGESLDPLLAIRFVTAFARGLPAGPLVVTRDGRSTGKMLASAIHAGLSAAGRKVLDGDVAATPTTGILVRQHKAAGGIQISASHNPPEYNGLKLFSADGRVLTAEAGLKVLAAFTDQTEPAWVPHDKLGAIRGLDDTLMAHLTQVLSLVNVNRIRQRRLNVMLDSNHGAGSLLGSALLRELGCDVSLLGDTPDGAFDHPPEPTAENLARVSKYVATTEIDVAFCQDPDADRLAVIDENGSYIGEEYTLALCLERVLQQKSGPVVTNCATSRMAQDIAEKYGAPFYRSAVGEANVCDLMIEKKAIFGGEGSGGPIDPRVGYVRDSFVGMALILDSLAATDATVSGLVRQIPRYEIYKAKFTVDRDRIPSALNALETHFRDAQASRQDGLRLDWPDRWLLVRASNTEPIVRAIAEAKTASLAQRMCNEAAAVATKA